MYSVLSTEGEKQDMILSVDKKIKTKIIYMVIQLNKTIIIIIIEIHYRKVNTTEMVFKAFHKSTLMCY